MTISGAPYVRFTVGRFVAIVAIGVFTMVWQRLLARPVISLVASIVSVGGPLTSAVGVLVVFAPTVAALTLLTLGARRDGRSGAWLRGAGLVALFVGVGIPLLTWFWSWLAWSASLAIPWYAVPDLMRVGAGQAAPDGDEAAAGPLFGAGVASLVSATAWLLPDATQARGRLPWIIAAVGFAAGAATAAVVRG